MAIRRTDLTSLGQKLMTTTDGSEAHRLIAKLVRDGANRFGDVAPLLIEYSSRGPLNHVRVHVTSLLAEMVPAGDSAFAGFFEAGLADPHLAYWSIPGLVRVSGPASFPVLTQFALNPDHSVEQRGKAVREMGLLSGQHFIRGLPADPGHWKEQDLPLPQLQAWAGAGFPAGPGFALPERHPHLDAPESALDRAASRLDAKLAKLRKAGQDPVNPAHCLVPATTPDVAAVLARWELPGVYEEFLRKFSPLHVTIVSRRHDQGLTLYGTADLLAAQRGYSFNPVEGTPIDGWPPQYVVIADHAGDPYVLDLSRIRANDAPVLTAIHGQGTWDFAEQAPSFLGFLDRLGR